MPIRVILGIMEKKMETLGPSKGYIVLYRGYIVGSIGIMEKKMETTIRFRF